ncbi:MAG: hypothetical protein EA364_01050 [Balneolaceae bacterium]|nr:MAG: hypothetical protein EA364_01050 [Balneolaceae bacterium]
MYRRLLLAADLNYLSDLRDSKLSEYQSVTQLDMNWFIKYFRYQSLKYTSDLIVVNNDLADAVKPLILNRFFV